MSSSNKNIANATSVLTPAAIAKKLSEIVPANTKEIIEETKQYLDSNKLDLDGYRQIWKGIFFAMWASDKVPVQEHLADELSNLVFSVYKKRFEAIQLWFQAGFSIMNKEWDKIDYWRVNKFSSFMRKIITAFIRYLRKKGFNIDYVRQFNKTIHQELYLEITQTVGGLALHVMQIYPEIISNFTRANHDQTTLLLDLFLKQLSSSACKNLRQKIKETIFDKIIELKTQKSTFQNLNMKNYREKLFEIAKKKKTEDTSRKELYEVIELIDAQVNLDEEEERYQTYLKNKEENRAQVMAQKTANGKELKKDSSKKNNKEKQETTKKEEKTNKKANLETQEAAKQKKQKLNDTTAKTLETKVDNKQKVVEQPKKIESKEKKEVAAEAPKAEQKLSKKDKKELKKQEKLEKLIEEEEKMLLLEEKKLNKMEQKLAKKDAQDDKSKKIDIKDLKKKQQEEVEDWEDEEDDEEDNDFEGEQEDDDEDEEDFEDEEDGDDDDDDDEIELPYGEGEEDDEEFDDDEELDEEELQMLIKGTADDIEVDDMDDDFYGEDDFEGYDVSDVTNNTLRINGLQNVYNSLPEYHFLSDPQKTKYFNGLTNKFKQNLLKEKTNGCSHKKSVVINTNNNLVKEFDLNEEVIAIQKAPVMKKTKKVKPTHSS